MNIDELIEPLEKALLVAEPARTYDFRLFFQINLLRDNSSNAPVEFGNLLHAIKAVPSLEIFDSANQGFEEIDFLFLLSWMISRGQRVGAAQVIEDIRKYLSVEIIEITKYLLVRGLSLCSSVAIGDFTLIPWKDIPQSDTKYHLSVQSGLSFNIPDFAICSKKIIKKHHKRFWESVYEVPETIDSLTDLIKCMSVVQEIGVQLIGLWEMPPTWAPWKVAVTSFGINNQLLSPRFDFVESSFEPLKDLHASWLNLDIETKQHLRLPLDRLNNSVLHNINFVDSSIDLGIAFESTFLSNKEREQIGALIRLRAAKYLETNVEERRKLVNQVKDVYSLRSLAVHRGTFDGEKKWSDPNKVFDTIKIGRQILRAALKKHIISGVPNWELIDLG